MKVSIIIPCYNNQKYVASSIECALNQTWKSVEVIVIDDGSTDESLSIINRYKDDIKIITQSNSGASSARNNGFKNATGEYINYFDADDLMSLDKIEKSINSFNDEVDIVFCDKMSYKESEHKDIIKEWRHNKKYIKELIKKKRKWNENNVILSTLRYSIQTNASLIRSSVIKKYGGFDERLSNQDDMEFYYRMAINGVRFKKIDEVMVFIRDHESPTRLRKSKKQPINALRAQDIMYEQTVEKCINDKSVLQLHSNRYARFGRKLHQVGEKEKANYSISKAYMLSKYPKPTSNIIYNLISNVIGIKRFEGTLYNIRKKIRQNHK